jgi:hypothetical protein
MDVIFQKDEKCIYRASSPTNSSDSWTPRSTLERRWRSWKVESLQLWWSKAAPWDKQRRALHLRTKAAEYEISASQKQLALFKPSTPPPTYLSSAAWWSLLSARHMPIDNKQCLRWRPRSTPPPPRRMPQTTRHESWHSWLAEEVVAHLANDWTFRSQANSIDTLAETKNATLVFYVLDRQESKKEQQRTERHVCYLLREKLHTVTIPCKRTTVAVLNFSIAVVGGVPGSSCGSRSPRPS